MSNSERDQGRLGGPEQPESGPALGQPDVPATEPTTPAIPPVDIQSYIGAQLRAVYDDVANQPVPDRFVELMRRLG